VSDSQKWSTDEPAPAVIPFDSVQAKAHQERWASHLSLPVEFENSIGMTFRLIPPGEYLMGSSEEQLQPVIGAAVGDSPWEFGIRSEAPPRPVRLIRPVYFSTTELTQEQYDRVMRADESTSNEIQRLSVGKLPTLHVNWLDAAEFCLRLSATEGLSAAYQVEGGAVRLTDGAGYRMPTEAEWEFACRAGSAGFYSGGETEEQLSKTGWYAANSGLELHPVGSKGANPFGICDLHGNAWEWVQDEWGLDRENCRVIKGGHCKNAAFHCRSASRLPAVATDKDNLITIRVVLNVDEVRLTR
jgi:formylglycine-generating enzyme required for sulfatase activity